MKKNVKFLTLLLALVMMLQTAPLAAMSVSAAEADGEQEGTQMIENTDLAVVSKEWRNADVPSNLTPLTDGMTLDCNYVLVRLTLNDTVNTAEAKVDGVDVATKLYRKQVMVYVELMNGVHSFEFTINGTLTHSFTVNVEGTDPACPQLKVEGGSAIVLGETNQMVITGQNLESVGDILVKISMTPSMKVTSVDIAKGLIGTYSWYRGDLRLNLSVYDASKLEGNVLATVSFKTPVGMTPDTELSWTVDSMEVTPAEGETLGSTDTFLGTTSQPETQLTPSGGYTVEMENEFIVGNTEQTIVVKDPAGNPAAGVPVYGIVDGENVLLGVTDEEGKITTDFFDGKGTFDIFVQDEEGVSSFVESVYSYEAVGSADGTPYGIMMNSISGGKVFTWMSNLAATSATPVVLLSANADMTDAVTYTGTSEVQYYHTSEAANRYNTVTVTDLQPGVYYYRVGDGTVFSAPMAFTVKTASDDSYFAVTSTASPADLALVAGAMNASGLAYDFAVQTESIMSDDSYEAYLAAMETYAGFGAMDLIHAHVRKDGGAYNNDACYAGYAYGNVFVAVVNYTEDKAELNTALSEMVWDANSENYDWRVLVINRSPNAADADAADAMAAELVPVMAQQATVDLVVWGDGASYERTEALFDGEVAEFNGVTYLMNGADPDYNAMYVSVATGDAGMTVTVYNVSEDGTAEVVDSFNKVHTTCPNDDHYMRFGVGSGYLYCDRCSHKEKLGEYEGTIAWNDKLLYLHTNGFGGGWREHNGRTYFFDTSTFLAVDGRVKIGSYYYVFEDHVLVEGAIVSFGDNKKLAWGGKYLADTWHTQGGKTYYLLSNGYMAVGTVDITMYDENGEPYVQTFIFDEDGALIGPAA